MISASHWYSCALPKRVVLCRNIKILLIVVALNMHLIHPRKLGRFTLRLFQAYFILFGVIVSQAIAAAEVQADHILIVKSTRTMTLMRGARILKTYKVALGTVPAGA